MIERCSIVIPTIHRPQAVRQLINDIAAQEYPNKEIIIVDQSDSRDEQLSIQSGIQYVHLDVASTPHARNVGTQVAQGEVVVFFDDDVRLHDTNLIAKIMHFLKEHEAYSGVACTIDDANQTLNRENIKQHPTVMSVTASGKVLPYAHGPEQDVVAPRGGAMAFRKESIIAVGGFDERYTGNAMREETDFSLRVVENNGKIRYLPQLRIEHLGLPQGGSRNKDRMQWYQDFFSNEFLFQLTHFSYWYIPFFFVRKVRPILACISWYGKLRPRAWATPWKGFRDGWKKFKKDFTPYAFS